MTFSKQNLKLKFYCRFNLLKEDAGEVGDVMRCRMYIHKMLTEPTTTHLFNADNRFKICQFVDKYATRLYSTRAVSTWFTKNEGKTVFDMVTMSAIAYTVAHGMRRWTQVTDMRNHPRRQLSLQRGDDSRENTILQDGVRRVSTSITRCGRDGQNYLEITEWDSGKNWTVSGLNMLKGLGENKKTEQEEEAQIKLGRQRC